MICQLPGRRLYLILNKLHYLKERITLRNMHINELLKQAVEQGASDLHISSGAAPAIRLDGRLHSLDLPPLLVEETMMLTKQVMSEEKYRALLEIGEVDFSYNQPGIGCFRINAYFQQGSVSLACRVINTQIPTIDSLMLPEVVKSLASRSRGLIIVTGPAGSGKSTTLAAMIDHINSEKFYHIITLEDPIEYLHSKKKSIINQREIGRDTKSFPNALRSALRQDPDVILVGEMRDLETMSIAITAAETGHLVMATLHTMDAPQTVERIIDVFPSNQQEQIRVQLASTLAGVLSQRLLRRQDGLGRIAAVEILTSTPAVRNLIREKKVHQIYSFMQTGSKHGMQTLDAHLQKLLAKDLISPEEAMEHATDLDTMTRFLQQRAT